MPLPLAPDRYLDVRLAGHELLHQTTCFGTADLAGQGARFSVANQNLASSPLIHKPGQSLARRRFRSYPPKVVDASGIVALLA